MESIDVVAAYRRAEHASPRDGIVVAVGRRVIDVSVAVVALLLTAIPLVFAAIVVRIDSRGPAFYRQERVGRMGKRFTCWKIRTMTVNADELLQANHDLRAQFSVNFKLHHDPRVTRVGRFLRRSSLDELPQLWSVLRGDMSVVGPRPLVPDELVRMYGRAADEITAVKPGLTGLWQVSGRSALSYEARVELDLRYVRERSLLLDATILLKTPIAVITGRGAM